MLTQQQGARQRVRRLSSSAVECPPSPPLQFERVAAPLPPRARRLSSSALAPTPLQLGGGIAGSSGGPTSRFQRVSDGAFDEARAASGGGGGGSCHHGSSSGGGISAEAFWSCASASLAIGPPNGSSGSSGRPVISLPQLPCLSPVVSIDTPHIVPISPTMSLGGDAGAGGGGGGGGLHRPQGGPRSPLSPLPPALVSFAPPALSLTQALAGIAERLAVMNDGDGGDGGRDPYVQANHTASKGSPRASSAAALEARRQTAAFDTNSPVGCRQQAHSNVRFRLSEPSLDLPAAALTCPLPLPAAPGGSGAYHAYHPSSEDHVGSSRHGSRALGGPAGGVSFSFSVAAATASTAATASDSGAAATGAEHGSVQQWLQQQHAASEAVPETGAVAAVAGGGGRHGHHYSEREAPARPASPVHEVNEATKNCGVAQMLQGVARVLQPLHDAQGRAEAQAAEAAEMLRIQ